MKLVINLLGLAAAAYFGYTFEPKLRPLLTGIQPGALELGRSKRVVLDFPGDAPNVDLGSLTLDQLPKKLVLKTAVDVSDASSGTTMTIKAGSQVKLIRIEGANAVVSPGDDACVGVLPITDTDLFQQLAAQPPTGDRLAVAPPIIMPQEADVPEPELVEAKAPVEEAPTTTATTGTVQSSPDTTATADLVVIMQESIKSSEIQEFTSDQVSEWRAEADESVEGVNYKTGSATFKAETLLGSKTLKAKALIKNGKVQRWVWPHTGKQMK
jgi:hypothetical protein